MNNILSTAEQLGPLEVIKKLSWRVSRWVNTIVYRNFIHWKSKIELVQYDHEWICNPKTLFLVKKESLDLEIANGKLFTDKQLQKIIRDADQVLTGPIRIHGLGSVEFRTDSMNWYGYGSKYARAVNRHDFVPVIAKAYAISDEAKYADKLKGLFDYWIDNFSLGRLLKHDKPIDTAIRLLNWIWAINFVGKSLNVDVAKLIRIIYVQAEYILARLSHSGNHLLLEILAIYVYSVLFSDLKFGKKWMDFSRPIFFEEINRQVTKEGIHSEQSTFYHHVVCTHFLKGYLVARNNGHQIPLEFSEKLKSMLDYVHQSMKPDLTFPMLGDGDQMLSDDREHWETKVILAARTFLFGEPVCESFKSTINDSPCWFFGLAAYELSATEDLPSSSVFRETGLAILRDAENYILFNAAPFGSALYPHHGHADALHVELCFAGKTVLMDPGGYAYVNDAMRFYVRSTRAHNTIVVDGIDQSEIFGVFGYGKLADTKMTKSVISEKIDVVEGVHYGYWPIIHKRQLIFKKGNAPYVVIIDYVVGKGRHKIEKYLHLSPDYRMNNSKNKIVSIDGVGNIDIWRYSPVILELETRKGVGGKNPDGWVCLEAGKPIKSEVVVMSAECELPAKLITVLSPEDTHTQCEYWREDKKLRITTIDEDEYLITNHQNGWSAS